MQNESTKSEKIQKILANANADDFVKPEELELLAETTIENLDYCLSDYAQSVASLQTAITTLQSENETLKQQNTASLTNAPEPQASNLIHVIYKLDTRNNIKKLTISVNNGASKVFTDAEEIENVRKFLENEQPLFSSNVYPYRSYNFCYKTKKAVSSPEDALLYLKSYAEE